MPPSGRVDLGREADHQGERNRQRGQAPMTAVHHAGILPQPGARQRRSPVLFRGKYRIRRMARWSKGHQHDRRPCGSGRERDGCDFTAPLTSAAALIRRRRAVGRASDRRPRLRLDRPPARQSMSWAPTLLTPGVDSYGRQRSRDSARDSRSDFRSVCHEQARRPGQGPRPRHHPTTWSRARRLASHTESLPDTPGLFNISTSSALKLVLRGTVIGTNDGPMMGMPADTQESRLRLHGHVPSLKRSDP